ncbi:Mitochondrial distribution and morphology protein 12 [Parahypoxylon ruwenzoriense]
MSDKKPPPTPLSPATIPPSSAPKSRDGSVASASFASLHVDKDQLAQALNSIHTSSREKDVLTTFKALGPPPEPSTATESKGITGDLVQNGLSGLYSRFKEAVGVSVGVSGKDKATASTASKENSDLNDGDAASKKSSSTTATTSKNPVSLLRVDTGVTGSTFNSTSSDLMASTTTSSETAPTSESQSQQPQSTMASSVTNLTGWATNSKSASSSFQSIPNMTKPTAAVAPVHVSAFKDGPRGALPKTEDGQTRGNRRSISKPSDGQPVVPAPEIPTLYDAPGSKRAAVIGKVLVPGHSKRDEGLSMDGNTDVPTSPTKGSNIAPIISAAPALPSSDSNMASLPTRLSAKDAVRRPTLIDRIGYSRTPGDLSRSSSVSRGTTEHSPINTSAHNSVHHESFAQVPEPQRMKSGEYRIPGTTTDEGAPEIVNAKLASMRKQVLSKDFWMADETCKECFLCTAPFTAFRRKHHCRTCGCIFDSGCTSIISGQRFGVQGTLRVCKPCLSIILQRQDGAISDDSADDSFLPAIFRQNPPKRACSPFSRGDRDDASISERAEDIDDDTRSLAAPMMAIPAARRIGESSNRNSAVLEIDAPQLSRPSSSRSLRSSTLSRPQSSGHRRHHSKHNLWNRLKASPEQRAPFRKSAREEAAKKIGLHAFHDDNVIDPDLAPFMSDESSGDEQMSIAGVMAGSDPHASPATDAERSNFGAYLNAGRRVRNRTQTEKSISGVSFTSRGLDELHPRSSRRRNMSIASGHHVRSPRPKSSAMRGPTGSNETLPLFDSPASPDVPRLTRSSSMKGDKEPRLELNPASLLHVRKLLRQLLQDSDVPNVSAWEKALVPILLKCTSSVDPDIDRGDDIDIRHYVKLKKIPGGRPSDTCYVSGVIFTKKLALKSMPRRMASPRVVIVSFPIEYQRHQQQFMSLQPVIEQEREFLRQLVNRIIALRPQLLLAEKSVSGLAMQFLSDAKIAVAYNVKPSVLSAVSRCLETEIISSVDMLALPPHQFQTGKSTGYEVKTFVNEDIPGRKKTYIFLSSNQEELGCTIALRGAPTTVLAKLKRITEFMVYVVYNLKLESCLMRDSYIQLPTSEDLSEQPSQATDESLASLGAKTSNTDDDGQGSLSTMAQEVLPSQDSHPAEKAAEELPGDAMAEEQLLVQSIQQTDLLISLHGTHSHSAHDSPVPEDIPMPTFYSDMVAKYETKILSASPFVKFAQPYLLMKAREQERRLVRLKRLRDQDVVDERIDTEKSNPQKFQLIKPRMVLETGHKAPRQIMEILHAVHDAEYDKALYNYQTQTRQWENYIQGNIGLFEPYAHQSIVVLHSVICTETKIPCLEPTLIALGFYDEHVNTSSGMDPDCTLGQYIEDICYGADTTCTANGCDRKMYEHHRTYVHGEARITIFIEQDTRGRFRGDNIMMWSYCKLCKRETSEMEMSKGTWKYSFGKYLELSFWSRGTHLVKDEDADGWNCPHDHHRDHIRYFGLNDKTIRIHYDPIDLLEIIVPRARITWNVEHDLNMKNEIFTHAQDRWTRFTTSVKARLKAINTDNILPEKTEACKVEMERLSKRIQDDHISLIRKLQDKYMDSKYYEVIPFNVVLREMLVKVAEWDVAFTKFEADFLPSDKDIRRLTMIHLRKMFTDESKESLSSNETSNEMTDVTEETTQTSVPDSEPKADSQPMEAESDHAQLTADQEKATLDAPVEDATHVPAADAALERVEPLDLAITKSPVHNSSAPSQSENSLDASQIPPLVNSTPTPATSPDLAPKSTTTAVPPMSLAEQVEQIRRRQSGIPENTAATTLESEQPKVTTDPPKTSERGSSRRMGLNVSPPMIRAMSQPVNSTPTLPRMHSAVGKKIFGTSKDKDRAPSTEAAVGGELRKAPTAESGKGEKKLFSSLRPHRKSNQSAIPRFVGKKDSRVTTIRKHFEQLSREFEKEREKDRKKRADKMSHSRPFLQHSTTKAIVEVYEDVDEAVQEPGPIEEDQTAAAEPSDAKPGNSTGLEEPPTLSQPVRESSQELNSPKNVPHRTDETATEVETDDQIHNSLGATDDEQGESDTEHSLIDGTTLEEIAESFDSSTEIPMELPKQDKNNFMRVLTNFWNERSASQWPPLDYPLNATDHIFIDSDIIVREDEPSSLIAFALSSEDYKEKLRGFYQKKPGEDTAASSESEEEGATSDTQSDKFSNIGEIITESQLEVKLVHTTSSHYKYQFTEGTAKMLVKIFYAEQFDALRRKCGVADRIVESLSRCLKWDSKGGKTKSVFLKTQDDRLVMKSLSPVETAAFLKFAPAYFSLMAEALFHDLPSVIAKMLGFFQVVIKNPVTSTEIKLDLLLMENLFYDRAPTRIFDLKGSMRNRKIQSTGEQNEVLLDENMVEYIYESPLFAREHSKKLLRVSVWNDTLFLARQNVMDYSLMIAVDEVKKELVVGIIDCIRTYTWDKKLESWIKDRGFAGGGRNRPTVTSPKEYKSRFREAMARYILEAPNCWHQFAPFLASRPRAVELNMAGDQAATADAAT